MRIEYQPESAHCTHRLLFEGAHDVGRFRRTQWLLTDGLGGFAMGTALGLNTRRYHGLLVHANRPPVDRQMLLNAVGTTLKIHVGSVREQTAPLSTFEFAGGHVDPQGYRYLSWFERGPARCAWRYVVGDFSCVIEVAPLWRRGGVVLRYMINGPTGSKCRLGLTPLMRLDSFHRLNHAGQRRMQASGQGEGVVIESDVPARARLTTSSGVFEARADWWYRLHYAQEMQRRQDDREDLFTAGEFVCDLTCDDQGEAVVTLTATPGDRAPQDMNLTIPNAAHVAHLESIRERLAQSSGALHQRLDLLAATDDFIVPRRRGDDRDSLTIMAGYPWFGDWGRDAMIALPGLLLATQRYGEALKVLGSFAAHCQRGLVPNLFDENGTAAHYNTVDASLWFIHAACEYEQCSGDRAGFDATLLEACLSIVQWYEKGTDYGIGVDPEDGLVRAGDASTQLTWMDAKRDGVVFTPRHGKAVEINALWHHALCALAEVCQERDPATAASLRKRAQKVRQSFGKFVIDQGRGGLADVLTRDGHDQEVLDSSVRANQIIAISVANSPVDRSVALNVLGVVERELLTPTGLRTLSPSDPRYRGRYEGSLFDRDGAYHQGTVWPWLMGPYAEAVLRLDDFSKTARNCARSLVAPLLVELKNGPSLGQLCEVYDGDSTPDRLRAAGGCMGQAWSVAAVCRVLALCENARSAPMVAAE